MQDDLVLSALDERGVLTVTLNRVAKAHAIDEDMLERLSTEFEKLSSGTIQVLLLKSNGRHFCSGFDLSDHESCSQAELAYRFIRIEQLLQKVRYAPCVTAAVVKGAAYGAGADLVAACQYRVGLPDARFRFPGFQFGVALGTRRLVELIGGERAEQILLQNEIVDAEAALYCGLLNRLTSIDQAEAVIQDIILDGLRLDSQSRRSLFRHTRQDTYDIELAELVRSVTRPGLHSRISSYLAAYQGGIS